MLSAGRIFCAALLGSIALCAFAANGYARPYAVVHTFAGPPNDGSYPYNPLSFDSNGAMYGATNLGGTANAGTIFQIAQGGAETLLHSFDGGSGGSDPNAGVTIDPATGDIYGSTTFGGSNACRNGCGILFRLAAGGGYSVLHTFKNGSDGEYPVGTLARDRRGNLYGIATSGGPDNAGTVFRYSAKGAFQVLHTFDGTDGFSPQGSLLLDRAGSLYGVTNQGGADNYGTVYRLATDGKNFSVLYNFTGGTDGGYPAGGLARDKAGNFYGTTDLAGNGQYPNGTVYKLTPSNNLTTLYIFGGGADGAYPESDLLQFRGQLYGTTTGGGANGDGVVFKVDPVSGTETVLHGFAGTDGANPHAGLVEHKDRLYGAASAGGGDGLGVLFSVRNR